MEAIETFEQDGWKAEIHYDEWGSEGANPRGYDNLGTMVCWHPDYILGDFQIKDGGGYGAVEAIYETDRGRSDFKSMRHLYRYVRLLAAGGVVLPLYLYDHSGISMRAGSPSPFDNPTIRRDHHGHGLGWDTSMVGYIYTTEDRIRELCGDGAEYREPAWIANALEEEVEEYDLYLTGQVYYWLVRDPDGDVVESCGGYLGHESAEEEAKAALASAAQVENANRHFQEKADRLAAEREEILARIVEEV